MILMERARTVIPENGRIMTFLYTPYQEQLIARAEHRRKLAAITGITQLMQQRHSLGMTCKDEGYFTVSPNSDTAVWHGRE